MAIQESGENYLETILILKERNGYVRSIDIAHETGFSKPSVSRAVSILKKEGLVEIDPLNQILLTDKGREIAEGIYLSLIHIFISYFYFFVHNSILY